MTEQQIEKNVERLREIFADKFALPISQNTIEKVIYYDADCPSYEVGNFSICPPDDTPAWGVLAWTYDHGDRETPPDVSETELGTCESFYDCIVVVWIAIARQEFEAKCESLAAVDEETVF